MKKRFGIGVIAFILMTISMAAVAQSSSVPDEKRLRFVDEKGVEIESYCVAPLYGKGIKKPFSVQKGDGKLYLIAPVIVKEGDGGFYLNWERRTEHSSIKLRNGLFIEEWFVPNTLLLLKAGRAPFLTSMYTGQNATKTVVFPKGNGDSNAAIDLLTSDSVDIDAIRNLYETQVDGYIRYGHQNMPLVYSYTKEEKELLRKCYKK